MMNRLKDEAQITNQDPIFKARYIGKTETFAAFGKGCTTALVQKLWDNSKDEHLLKRVQIRITTSGLYMKSLEKKNSPESLFDIENISFCTVDTAVNDRIFSWIYRDDEESIPEVHAIVCSSSEKAKSMALVLSRAFQIAYREWKALQIKSARNDEMKQRSASLGTLDLPTKLSRSQGPRSQSQKTQNESITTIVTQEQAFVNGLSNNTIAKDDEPEIQYKTGNNKFETQTETGNTESNMDSKEIGVQVDSEKL